MDYSRPQPNSRLGTAFQYAFAEWTKHLFDRIQNTAVEDLNLSDLRVEYWFDGADEEGFNLQLARGPSEYTSECSWSNLGRLSKSTLSEDIVFSIQGASS